MYHVPIHIASQFYLNSIVFGENSLGEQKRFFYGLSQSLHFTNYYILDWMQVYKIGSSAQTSRRLFDFF